MPLTLTVLRCPDQVVPETRTIHGGEFTVGRGPGVDWVLPDPERLLSKHHFAVAFRSGAWQIADTSTNGTTMNRDPAPIGPGEVRTLRDGDRLTLGAYDIEVRLEEDAIAMQDGIGGMAAGFGSQPASRGASPFGEPFGMDPMAPPQPPRTPFNEAPDRGFGLPPTSAQLPHDFDPLAPEPGEAFYPGPTRADHSSVMDDAFRAPPVIGHGPLQGGNIIPADNLLPDDWDKDLEGINPPAPRVKVAPLAQPAAQPIVQPLPPTQFDANPFGEPSDTSEDVLESRSIRPAAILAPSPPEPRPASPVDAVHPAAPLKAAPAPQTAGGQPTLGATDGLLAAFLDGAGMSGAQPSDPVAMMRGLGQAFRTMVAGLRSVLIARASIKSEFRIEQTMIRARGNNPLKFSAGEDDALAALLGIGRRVDMSPSVAVADALRDIRLHELASMAAMQAAVRALLSGLDPAKLRAQADQAGGLSVLPLQRKARAWDAYEALHQHTVQALADDFDSVFGKAFARAYERALDEVSAKQR